MTDLLQQLLSLIPSDTQRQLAQLIEEFKGRRKPGETVMQAVEREQKAGNLKLVKNSPDNPAPPAAPTPQTQQTPTPSTPPTQETPPAPAAPSPATAPAPAPANPEPPAAPAPEIYRFKDGAAIEKVMSGRYGRNWAASMGINQMDLMKLIGTTPSEQSVQQQLSLIYRQGDGGIGAIQIQTARGSVSIPISQAMIERVPIS